MHKFRDGSSVRGENGTPTKPLDRCFALHCPRRINCGCRPCTLGTRLLSLMIVRRRMALLGSHIFLASRMFCSMNYAMGFALVFVLCGTPGSMQI